MKVSRATYFRCIQMVNAGVQMTDRRTLKLGKTNYKGRNAFGYIQSYVKRMGDPSPETQRILMPVCVTKKTIYEEYKAKEGDHIGIKRFYQILKQNFKHVSFPKCLKNSITGCDICMLAKDLIAAAGNDDIKEALIKDRDLHLNNQQTERDFYYERRADAITHPNQKCSLIADGMDQAKTDLPHYKGWKKPKTANKGRLRTHVLGVILHGHKTHFFLDLLQWPHDANLVLNGILNTLHAKYSQQNKLPPTMYVQLDNCGRENKNRYILGFFSILVQKRLVNEVILGFLMQGHTHEDIDQRFSKVSHILKRRDARTLPELKNVLMGCLLYSQPDVTVVGNLFDIKAWISDCLLDIHNHSHPHVFKIIRENGQAVLYYKMWSTDEGWQPENGIKVLKSLPDGTVQVPTGQAGFVEQSWEKQDFDEMRKGVENQKHQMNFEQWQWWVSFLETHSIANIAEDPVWWLDGFFLQDSRDDDADNADFVSPLSLLINKQNRCPDVYTGKKPASDVGNKKQNKKKEKTVSYEACVGVMVAFKSKVKEGDVKVGKITEVNDTILTVHMHEGKLSGILTPAKTPNGNNKICKIARERVVYVFQLTNTKKVPALVLKKIHEILER